MTLSCLSRRSHVGVIKLGPLGVVSLSLCLQTHLDQYCLFNIAFSTFAGGAGFLQSVSMTGFIWFLWVAFGLSAALLSGLHAHVHSDVFSFVTNPFLNSLRVQHK